MKRVKGILSREAIDRKYAPRKHRKPKEQSTEDPSKHTYTIKFFSFDESGYPHQLGTRQTSSLNVATREAERWALTDDTYVASLEWESITGHKITIVNPDTARAARKERNAYKKLVRSNGAKQSHVSS